MMVLDRVEDTLISRVIKKMSGMASASAHSDLGSLSPWIYSITFTDSFRRQ